MRGRDIFRYQDPFEPSLEEKLFLAGKRLCILFAGCAIVLGMLDIVGVRTLQNANDVVMSARTKFAGLGDTIRTGVSEISISPSSPSVTVLIPKSTTQVATQVATQVPTQVANPVAKKENPTIARLDALRSQDAVMAAMTPPSDYVRWDNAPAVPVVAAKAEAVPAVALTSFASTNSGSVPAAAPAKPALAVAVAPAIPEPAPAPAIKLASADAASSFASVTPAALPMGESPGIPLAFVPLPREAPGVPPPSPAERLGLKDDPKAYAKAERCLANAIYFEARSEPVRGQMAVAQVVVNRAFSGFYPDNICDVVYQNAHRRLACQFTFACDGKRKVINERGEWARANRIAKQTLDGLIYLPEVGKSTHYHASYVRPNWVHEMKKLARYGLHSFYRPYAWGNGAEDPVWGSPALALAKVQKAK